MLSTETHAAPIDSIPLIDFEPFLRGSQRDKLRVARNISAACESIGFLYLKTHGVPQQKIDGIFAANRQFHALPLEVRMDPELRMTPQSSRGYVPLLARQWEGTGAPDLNEKIEIIAELPPDDPDILAGDRWHVRNKWPKGMPQWRATVLDYFAEMMKLTEHLHRSFALALDLDENYFAQFYKKPLVQMNLIHYPPQPAMAPGDEYGIHPHTDQTSVTILAQEDIGGLQVQTRDGRWIDASPIPGTFVINLGYMMARWTNDRFAATPHRVLNRQGRERYSIAFFNMPDFDAVVECLPGCKGLGNPAKYPPLHVGPSLKAKYVGDWNKISKLGDAAVAVR